MIDLHCHILPTMDDGAQSIAEAILMAEAAVSQGISRVLCTPHHNNGKDTNSPRKVKLKTAELQQELDKRRIPLVLVGGQEIRISGSLIEQIKQKDLLFVDTSNKYLLIEFPAREIPAYADKLFFELLVRGHTPILVHPERNGPVIGNPNLLAPFLEMGVLTQLTAASYVGCFGKKIARTAKQMVAHNMVHIIASDAHSNIGKRGFFMKEAYGKIQQDFGEKKVVLMQQTAKDILNGNEVIRPQFTEFKRKKLGLF